MNQIWFYFFSSNNIVLFLTSALINHVINDSMMKDVMKCLMNTIIYKRKQNFIFRQRFFYYFVSIVSSTKKTSEQPMLSFKTVVINVEKYRCHRRKTRQCHHLTRKIHTILEKRWITVINRTVLHRFCLHKYHSM